MTSAKIPVTEREQHDVLVVGGGIAGISAAVSAARAGADVLLLERGVLLGGLATAGLISWYEPLCDGRGNQVIGGIAEELIRLAVACGFDNLPSEWGGESGNAPRNHRFSAFYSPTFFSLALDRFLTESGAHLLLDVHATHPVMDGGHCLGLLAETAAGREFFPAKIVIGATGDATICHRAGIPCVTGENYLTCIAHDMTLESAKRFSQDGDLAAFRHWRAVGSDYAGNGHPTGLPTFHGDSAGAITEFVLRGHDLLLRAYAGTDRNARDILTLPTMPQLRTVRHILGDSRFTGNPNAHPKDSIGRVGDFRRAGPTYEIPYSCLFRSGFDNLLAAGRIISTDREGWEITRVIPVCALTGEVAGRAAAYAARSGKAVADGWEALS